MNKSREVNNEDITDELSEGVIPWCKQIDQAYVELDKDSFACLETTLNKIKAKFIEAEKNQGKIYPSEQSR